MSLTADSDALRVCGGNPRVLLVRIRPYVVYFLGKELANSYIIDSRFQKVKNKAATGWRGG